MMFATEKKKEKNNSQHKSHSSNLYILIYIYTAPRYKKWPK